MVVDTEVEDDVGEAGVAPVALDDEQGGGLLAAPVAARVLRSREGGQQALRERAGGRRERVGERVDRVGRDEDVALGGKAVAGAAARPVEAPGTGVRRGTAGPVDDPQLALVPPVVRASTAEEVRAALARPEVACVLVRSEELLRLDLTELTYG